MILMLSMSSFLLLNFVQISTLEEIMTLALKTNKVEFVEVLMENGVSMEKYLTVRRLENLYREVSMITEAFISYFFM